MGISVYLVNGKKAAVPNASGIFVTNVGHITKFKRSPFYIFDESHKLPVYARRHLINA